MASASLSSAGADLTYASLKTCYPSSLSPRTQQGASCSPSHQPARVVPPTHALPCSPVTPLSYHGSMAEMEAVVSASLRNENELLRLQLNDIIQRERSQRIELQRLREHRDTEVGAMVRDATSHQGAEIDRLEAMLQSTSADLREAAAERDRLSRALDEVMRHAAANENATGGRLRVLEDSVSAATAVAAGMADGVEAFQRHVLPTFRAPPGFQGGEANVEMEADPLLGGQLARLERGIALLRMIVDAKSDTLVMIRGKLKAECESLREEVQSLRGQRQAGEKMTQDHQDLLRIEKGALRQELHSLQELYDAEIAQLRERLQRFEAGESEGQRRIHELQAAISEKARQLEDISEEKERLEERLNEESNARGQLVAQLTTVRRDHETTRGELETLKLSQKFLVRQPPGSSRIPAEKLDLMNMVNQLLLEVNKLKSEKIAVEEELKMHKRTQVRERMQGALTSRDISLAANDKVRDSELASKLVRQRLENMNESSSPPHLEGTVNVNARGAGSSMRPPTNFMPMSMSTAYPSTPPRNYNDCASAMLSPETPCRDTSTSTSLQPPLAKQQSMGAGAKVARNLEPSLSSMSLGGGFDGGRGIFDLASIRGFGSEVEHPMEFELAHEAHVPVRDRP